MKSLTHLTKTLFIGIVFLTSTGSFGQSINVDSVGTVTGAKYCTNTYVPVWYRKYCTNMVFTGNTVAIAGNTITININTTQVPICPGIYWVDTLMVNLGNVPAGSYSVTANAYQNSALVNTAYGSLVVGTVGCCPAQPSFTISSDTVCVGDSISFINTSVGATSHEWFENNNSAGTQTNYGKRYSMAGVYHIKLGATDGFCSDTAEKDIFVSAYPTVSLGNDTTTCPGDPVTLDAGSGRDAILWSTSSTSRYLIASVPGTYSVNVTENGCDGQDTIVISFYPNPPVVNLGNDTMICPGDSIILDATAPGVTYLWYDNTTNSTHVADTPGVYSVIIEDINTCKNSDEITISNFSTPLISLSVVPRNTICYGAPFEFRANSYTQGSIMYQWKINAINAGPQTTNNKFSPNLMYGDSVNVDLITDVCSSAPYALPSNYITMYLKPEPKLISGSSATDTVLENTSKNYLVPVIQGSTFTWSAIGGTIGSPVGNAVKVDWGSEMDTAKIMVTEKDAGNCSYTNVRNVVIYSIVGIKDESNMIGIGNAYPNPASTIVTIPVLIDGNWDIDLSLYDMTGKKVKAIFNGAVSGNREISFSVDDLQNGMYFYKVSTSEGYESVKKLNIKH